MNKAQFVKKWIEFIKQHESGQYEGGGVYEVHSNELLDFVCQFLGDEK